MEGSLMGAESYISRRDDQVALEIWFDRPEHPEKYVVLATCAEDEFQEVRIEIEPRWIGDSLKDARAVIPKGLARQRRLDADPPAFLEAWV
jgi:hypothetical protein